MAKLILSQPRFNMLVANLSAGSDPSKGTAGNPNKIRTGFGMQLFPEMGVGDQIPRVRNNRAPGIETQMGLLNYTAAGVPVGVTGTVTVSDPDFTDVATLYIGDYTVTSGDDFSVAGTAYAGEDITNTVPNGIIVIWKTAGAVPGEGTINVPANLPITPGTVTITWASGGVKTQTDDGLGFFDPGGDGTPAGSSINYLTGAITLDTTGDIPDALSAITIGYTALTADDVASDLAVFITTLPGFTATVLANVVTVTGPAGPSGNDLSLEAYYGGAVSNYTFAPVDGYFGSGEPVIGPPTILT